MSVSELTPATQDYLKVIWAAGEWSDAALTTTALSQKMGFSPSTVSEAIKKLTEQGLVSHARYGSIELTDAGRLAALGIVRRHRLIETFLVEYLGYTWDEVHDDAEILEHAVTDRLVDRLDARLGHPVRDPHGDPIPSRDTVLPVLDAIPLAVAEIGARTRVARVSDADPELLRYLADVGIVLDTELVAIERRDYAGILTVSLGDRAIDLGIPATEAIWVSLV